jgi:hypothetical protein
VSKVHTQKKEQPQMPANHGRWWIPATIKERRKKTGESMLARSRSESAVLRRSFYCFGNLKVGVPSNSRQPMV